MSLWGSSELDRRNSEYLHRIAEALEGILTEVKLIAQEVKPQPNIPVSLRVTFGDGTNSKGEKLMGSTNSFSDPDVNSVPFTIEAVDGNGVPFTPQTGDVFSLTSTDGNSVVTPNASDPTGATGSLTAKPGFSGPVAGAISFTPGPASVAAGAVPLSGTWTGTFTPGEPVALAAVFAPGVPPASAK